MSERAKLASEEDGAFIFALGDTFANQLLSRIDSLVRQEIQRLRDVQNPVLRLEGVLVSSGDPSSEVAERRVAFGNIDLSAWSEAASIGSGRYYISASDHDCQHQLGLATLTSDKNSPSPRRSKRKKDNSKTSSTCTPDTD